jgi:sugar fermentation stimulation protein A
MIDNLKMYTIVRRENRFVVTVENGSDRKKALVRNTGRLYDLIQEGYRVLCVDKNHGRTGCIILGVTIDERAVILDPFTQVLAFEHAVRRGLIPWLKGWEIERKEIPVAGSRLDYLIKNGASKGYMECKSAAYCDGYYSMYPDCPSERGLKHICELDNLKADGYRAIVAFMAAHPHAREFMINAGAHKELASRLDSAHKNGVEVYAVKLFMDINGSIFLENPDLPVNLSLSGSSSNVWP